MHDKYQEGNFPRLKVSGPLNENIESRVLSSIIDDAKNKTIRALDPDGSFSIEIEKNKREVIYLSTSSDGKLIFEDIYSNGTHTRATITDDKPELSKLFKQASDAIKEKAEEILQKYAGISVIDRNDRG
ncbi:MAG: hypothetical protein WC662_04980 [Candidatus Paceibacterota bacterium]